jgi:WhiB family redox-sensing transcriptional regulator
MDGPGAWVLEGACIDEDPNLFFPGPGELNTERAAKAICDRCDVKDKCLEYAMSRVQVFGIWGGMNERERRRARSQARTEGQLSA